MLTRLEHENTQKLMPTTWSQEIVVVLNKSYQSELDKNDLLFEVFGVAYPTEIVLAVSLSKKNDEFAIPTTFHMSLEVDDKIDVFESFNTLIDAAGMFFDSYFNTPDWDEYSPVWDETEYKGLKFHYLISRENVRLSIEADKLLGE